MDRNYWEKIAQNYNEEIFDVFRNDKPGIIRSAILEYCSPSKTVMDIGCAVGKWIPLPNIKNKKDINFCLYKNKELVQQANSGLMINSFDKVLAHISNYFSVNIGDLVFTGTPAGVGECVVGDELEAFIEDDSLLALEVK